MPSPKEDTYTVLIVNISIIKTLIIKLNNQTGESINTLGHRKDTTVDSYILLGPSYYYATAVKELNSEGITRCVYLAIRIYIALPYISTSI